MLYWLFALTVVTISGCGNYPQIITPNGRVDDPQVLAWVDASKMQTNKLLDVRSNELLEENNENLKTIEDMFSNFKSSLDSKELYSEEFRKINIIYLQYWLLHTKRMNHLYYDFQSSNFDTNYLKEKLSQKAQELEDAITAFNVIK